MPTSLDPPPADDELECGRCGAHFYYDLIRCPNCGVNIYEPDEDLEHNPADSYRKHGKFLNGIWARFDRFIRRITRKPYPVDTLFGTSINQAALFDNLLVKVGGDRDITERLIDFERKQNPQGNRLIWLKNAIQRWERDNRTSGTR